jgi:hypothetical protein
MANKQVARELGIRESTVKTQVETVRDVQFARDIVPKLAEEAEQLVRW